MEEQREKVQEKDKKHKRGMVKCSLCGKYIRERELLFHNPQCYIRACDEIGTVPLCTCRGCEGRKTHDGDTLQTIGTDRLKEATSTSAYTRRKPAAATKAANSFRFTGHRHLGPKYAQTRRARMLPV